MLWWKTIRLPINDHVFERKTLAHALKPIDHRCPSRIIQSNFYCYFLADPCKLTTCLFGAQCVVNSSTGGTSCQCQEVCSDTFSPVCGSDGITYSSECRMRLKSCGMQKQIQVHTYKSCGESLYCEAISFSLLQHISCWSFWSNLLI